MSPVGPIELIRLNVRDLGAARNFYAGALKLPQIATDDTMTIFDTGQAKLIVALGDASAAPGPVELGFTVESLETAIAAVIAADARILAPPRTEAWGGRTATIADPDGNRLSLVQYP